MQKCHHRRHRYQHSVAQARGTVLCFTTAHATKPPSLKPESVLCVPACCVLRAEVRNDDACVHPSSHLAWVRLLGGGVFVSLRLQYTRNGTVRCGVYIIRIKSFFPAPTTYYLLAT
jgi:hypothetical protein